jgi:hypothetical protein
VRATQPNQSASITGTPGSVNATLEASFDVQFFTCPSGPVYAPSGTTLASTNFGATAPKTVTVTINKSAVTAAASFYQVCYESPVAFTDRSGTTTTLGLLPDCKTVSNVPPCVVSITKDRSGNIVEVLLVPAADPWVH